MTSIQREMHLHQLPTILCVIICTVLMSGCGPTFRSNLAQSDRVQIYELETAKKKKDAFEDIEIGIAKTYTSAKTVIDVKSPEKGRIILKALTSGQYVVFTDPICGPMEIVDLNYALDITVADERVTMEFDLGSPIFTGGFVRHPLGSQSSHYPPDMALVQRELDGIVGALAKAVDGKIVKRPTPIASMQQDEKQ